MTSSSYSFGTEQTWRLSSVRPSLRALLLRVEAVGLAAWQMT
jgi:hypothetical protein